MSSRQGHVLFFVCPDFDDTGRFVAVEVAVLYVLEFVAIGFHSGRRRQGLVYDNSVKIVFPHDIRADSARDGQTVNPNLKISQ